MTRQWIILSIGVLSLGATACSGYDEKNAAYDEANASYDSANATYDEGNAAYDANASYAPDANAAYTPPPDANASGNATGETPPADPATNGY